MTAAWRRYGLDELARQYSPSSCAPDMRYCLSEYAKRSESARRLLDVHEAVPYGPASEQRFDYFPAERPGAPLHVFVHGGYWQELGRAESSFAATGMVAAGAAFIALGYPLAPGCSLPAITAMVGEGIRWLCGHAPQLPGAPGRVHLSGHCAGAQLVAHALADTGAWRRSGIDPLAAVGSATLLGGVYDLEPLVGTYINKPLGLDGPTARACSPQHGPLVRMPPLLVGRGESETDEYARQHREFVARARSCGTDVTDLVVAGRHHFDLPLDLGRGATELGAGVLRLMGLRPEAEG
ncbi:alpha/beta hydrolase [Streptomyces sp. UNOB3_S3]|uniref:alpha/beta hydrolase n=1 Tax=Streptomyces sp. UNOB3_S3 TaxID=2871682 RepID=UPI001E642468|nr:alpha/beta hydrolase [Streptomyces sp. UNOB3_S3]MCC3774891.1 alpha/beta hydrolase [Streptomyces sp. UNOB3_S3]